MGAIRRIAGKDPSATLSVISLLAAPVAALAGHPEFAPVFVAVAAAILGLRTQVTPAAKATETAVQAARDAATTTAANLSEATAGRFGELSTDGAVVVNDAVNLVAGLLGGKK